MSWERNKPVRQCTPGVCMGAHPLYLIISLSLDLTNDGPHRSQNTLTAREEATKTSPFETASSAQERREIPQGANPMELAVQGSPLMWEGVPGRYSDLVSGRSAQEARSQNVGSRRRGSWG